VESAVKPKTRPGPLKMCTCICLSGSCGSKHLQFLHFSSFGAKTVNEIEDASNVVVVAVCHPLEDDYH